MANILLTAENFAYGPIGKLLVIAKELKKSGHKLTFVGFGTAHQLANKFEFDEVHLIDTDSELFEKKVETLVGNSDILVTAMDRSSTTLFMKKKKPVVWIDTLFWWWDKIPDFLWDVDLYLFQRSIDEGENLIKYRKKIKNLVPVGPIIEEVPINNKKRQLMIAFGGMEAQGWYKIGVDSNYPFTLTEIILREVDLSDFETVIVTGNEKIIEELKVKYNDKRFVFKALSHSEFVCELSSSELAMIVPGLETPLEAFYYKVPVIFLPPSNSSQYIQLDEFRDNSAAISSVHFRDLFPPMNVKNRDLKVLMKNFLAILREFESSDEAKEIVAKKINDFVISRKEWSPLQVLKGRAYIDKLGYNGLTEAVKEINLIVNKKI